MTSRPQNSSEPGWRFNRFGAGPDLVVLHGGSQQKEDIWSSVVSHIQHRSSVIVVENGSDVEGSLVGMRELLNHGRVAAESSRVILVGWADGIDDVLVLARDDGARIHGLVLCISPGFRANTPQEHAQGSSQQLPESIHITGILPASDPNLSSQLLVELSGSSSVREVIAGRSEHCSPLERPDVVSEAVLELLDRP